MEGDQNTTYFHKIYSIYQRKSLITEIEHSKGYKYTTSQAIAEAFINHYQLLFKDARRETLWINNLNWCPINTRHHKRLCAKFKEDEVKKTIDSLGNGKSPGPNGFTISFYKQNWQLIKNDVMEVFHDFYRNNIINK